MAGAERMNMNKAILIGRLTRDPEIRYSQGDNPFAIARYSIAVARKYKKDGEPDCDFINCIAFGKNGEFAEKYLHKGTKIAVAGRIQTGSYTNKEGQKVYTTDVIIEEHEFCESKGISSAGNNQTNSQSNVVAMDDGFMHIPDIPDEELPFS